MNITIVSWDSNLKNEEFFSDVRFKQFHLLKEILELNGHELYLSDYMPVKNADICIFFDSLGYGVYEPVFESIKCGNISKSIYFALEPPVVCKINKPKKIKKWCKSFAKVLCVQKDLNGKYNIDYLTDTIDKFSYKVDSDSVNINKKLLTSISGNKTSKVKNELYSERKKAYKFFEENIPDEFDFFGTGWDSENFSCYKGKCAVKSKTLKNYKFALAYENMYDCNGYITEKCIDVIKAGCVPIYKGAKDIVEYIDPNCIIFADNFDNYDDLFSYLKNMTDEEYNKYVECGKNFLRSEKFKFFSPEFYAEVVANSILTSIESNQSLIKTKIIINWIWLVSKCRGAIKLLKRIIIKILS